MTTSLSDAGVTFADNSVQARAVRPVPVRQTVLYGPVDTSGFSAFVGVTGSTTVTATGTIYPTAAAGSDATGNIDYTWSSVNPAWTSLSTNGTMYLTQSLSGGVVTNNSRTLAPIYQWGGTPSPTSGQLTFNIQQMTMYLGNGSTAPAVNEVVIGEVTVAGAVVTAITWYALMGRYDSGFTATLPTAATSISRNSLIGVVPATARLILECTTTDNGYAVGDTIYASSTGSNNLPITITSTRNTVGFATGATTAFVTFPKTGGGTGVGLTNANWKYKMLAERGW